jgi:hypothetical protein
MHIFNPKDHIAYLAQYAVTSEAVDRHSSSPEPRPGRHARIPSDVTDRSTSTIVAPNQLAVQETFDDPNQAASPLGDYSAQLAKFIQSQLNSIPAYTSGDSAISPRSCPDLSFAQAPSLKSPTLPPAQSMSMKRPVGAPSLIQIPSIRPPERSAFSEWSSTDDEADDEAPPLPDTKTVQPAPPTDPYTPSSVLHYYEQSNDSTFLFPSTPLGNDQDEPYTAKLFFSPAVPGLPGTQGEPSSTRDGDYPSSGSRLSLLSASSAPSLSSTSTESYFENNLPLSQVPDLKNRILAAVTPPPGKVLPAMSPFERSDLANVHGIMVQPQRSIFVDGLSFDMV